MPRNAPHIPVLLDEVIGALAISPGETHVDGTFGAGGYSRAMVAAGANVIAFDRDPDAIVAGQAWGEVSGSPPRLVLHPRRFSELAEGLAVSVPQLFTPAAQAQVSGRIVVTKSGEGQAHATATYEHELLAGALTKKQMLPYRATIRARDLAEFNGWVRHEGEEFLYVLTGVIRLYTEFYEPVDLRRGDSAYYDASMGHNVISLSEEDATILWVTSLA